MSDERQAADDADDADDAIDAAVRVRVHSLPHDPIQADLHLLRDAFQAQGKQLGALQETFTQLLNHFTVHTLDINRRFDLLLLELREVRAVVKPLPVLPTDPTS